MGCIDVFPACAEKPRNSDCSNSENAWSLDTGLQTPVSNKGIRAPGEAVIPGLRQENRGWALSFLSCQKVRIGNNNNNSLLKKQEPT